MFTINEIRDRIGSYSSLGENIVMIKGCNKKSETLYCYDSEKQLVSDKSGNVVSLNIDLDATSAHNLGLYLDTLFEQYYDAKCEFEKSLAIDRDSKESIQWEKL